MIRFLVGAAMAIAAVLIALTAVGVDPDSMQFPGGIAVGLYAAAFCIWFTDPESIVVPGAVL